MLTQWNRRLHKIDKESYMLRRPRVQCIVMLLLLLLLYCSFIPNNDEIIVIAIIVESIELK